jgi:hypothetical protein
MSVQKTNHATTAIVGFLIAIVLFVIVAGVAKYTISAPAIDADRAALRGKALAEITLAEETELTTAGVLDKTRGTVRLPLETAIALAQKWPNAAAARADLNARVEKATAEVKPVSFE